MFDGTFLPGRKVITLLVARRFINYFCVHWISCGFVFLNMTIVVKIVLW
jgi:hypothetical protein